MAVSMLEGRRTTQDSRERVYAITRQLISTFQENFQHTTCPDLLQLQLGTPEASAEYQSRGLHSQCEQYIRLITHTAVKLLKEYEDDR